MQLGISNSIFLFHYFIVCIFADDYSGSVNLEFPAVDLPEGRCYELEDSQGNVSTRNCIGPYGNSNPNCACTCDSQCVEARKRIAEVRISQCCVMNDMQSDCASICHYESNPEQLITKSTKCFNDLKRWVYCAADGQTNGDCCKARGVPDLCRSFCDGNVPSGKELVQNIDYLDCIMKVNDILHCHRAGLPKTKTWEDHHFPKDAPGANDLLAALDEN